MWCDFIIDNHIVGGKSVSYTHLADNWTADSKQAVKDAKAVVEEIAANEYVTQEVVDMAEKALLSAHKDAVVKGDVTALELSLIHI